MGIQGSFRSESQSFIEQQSLIEEQNKVDNKSKDNQSKSGIGKLKHAFSNLSATLKKTNILDGFQGLVSRVGTAAKNCFKEIANSTVLEKSDYSSHHNPVGANKETFDYMGW
jgi:hypothetical protein